MRWSWKIGQSARIVVCMRTTGGIPVGRAMLTDFQSLAPSDSLARAVELILVGSRQDFPVIENGRVVVLLTMDNVGEFVALQASLGVVVRF